VQVGLKDKHLTHSDKRVNEGSCKLVSNFQLEGRTMTAVIVAGIGIIFAVASWFSSKDLEDE